MPLEENSPLLFGIALLMVAVLNWRCFWGSFWTPFSLHPVQTPFSGRGQMKRFGISCPWEPSGQAPETSWVRQSQPVPQRNSKFCKIVVLILGINKWNQGLRNTMSIVLKGLGLEFQGLGIIWNGFLVVPGHGCDEFLWTSPAQLNHYVFPIMTYLNKTFQKDEYKIFLNALSPGLFVQRDQQCSQDRFPRPLLHSALCCWPHCLAPVQLCMISCPCVESGGSMGCMANPSTAHRGAQQLFCHTGPRANAGGCRFWWGCVFVAGFLTDLWLLHMFWVCLVLFFFSCWVLLILFFFFSLLLVNFFNLPPHSAQP